MNHAQRSALAERELDELFALSPEQALASIERAPSPEVEEGEEPVTRFATTELVELLMKRAAEKADTGRAEHIVRLAEAVAERLTLGSPGWYREEDEVLLRLHRWMDHNASVHARCARLALRAGAVDEAMELLEIAVERLPALASLSGFQTLHYWPSGATQVVHTALELATYHQRRGNLEAVDAIRGLAHRLTKDVELAMIPWLTLYKILHGDESLTLEDMLLDLLRRYQR